MKLKRSLVLATIFLTSLISMVLIVPVFCTDASDPDLQKEDDSGWHQFHLGPQHSGASSTSAPKTNETAWVSEDIGAQAGSSVTVAEGKVFVNCMDALACLDQFSGETLWTAPFEKNGDVCCSWFTPIYHDGKVLFTGMETVCLDAADGQEIWRFAPPTGRGTVDGSPVVVDGKVVVSDWDGQHYYCLNETSGEVIWNFSVEGSAQSTPAVSDGKVVFGAWEWGLGGNIYCADLDDGSKIWSIQTDNSPAGSASIQNGTVHMTTYNFNGNGDLLALSLLDGSILWRKEISPTDSAPTFAEGKVYVCGGCEGFSHSKTYCFDSVTGDLVWETDEDDKIGDWRCSMAYADGIVFVGKPNFDDFGGTVALDADTGDVVWRHPEGGSSPAIAGGMVFTVGDGKVLAFGESSHKEVEP